jgi:hypothetical protein
MRDILIPDNLYFLPELLWQEEPAREVLRGRMHGAADRLFNTDECRTVSVISALKIPRSTLEQKVAERAKPKTTLKMVYPTIPNIRSIVPIPQFEEVPVEEAEKQGEV